MEIVRGAQQEDNRAFGPGYLSFTRLERRKSLIERWRLISCCRAQVKFNMNSALAAVLIRIAP
jgi:hypothetical protein